MTRVGETLSAQRPLRALLLGGSAEARRLAARVAAEPRLAAIVSLAGRTQAPVASPLPMRLGGFGGVAGLADYLLRQGVEKVVDATHPFAARISANAVAACARTNIPLLVLTRPPWTPRSGDDWRFAPDMAAAARLLGEAPRRVFLTVGRQSAGAFRAAPQHDYLLRVIDPPAPQDAPARCELVCARGPFSIEDEIALMREKGIEILVTKNSGGDETAAKLAAARRLEIPVVLVERPAPAGGRIVHDVEAAMDFLTGAA